MMVLACLTKATIIYFTIYTYSTFLIFKTIIFYRLFHLFPDPKNISHCVRHYNLLNYIPHYESLSHTKNECTFPSLKDLVLPSLSIHILMSLTFWQTAFSHIPTLLIG